MAEVTLDFIKSEIERKYAPFVVKGVKGGDVKLLPMLRLSSEKRARLIQLQKDVERVQDVGEGEEDAESNTNDLLNILADLVKTVVETDAQADRLVKELGDDPAAYQTVFEMYSEATQPGEVSPSDD